MSTSENITTEDQTHLQRCIALAREALGAGDQPFGSVLVSADGQELFADRNRVSGGDRTQHPEFAIARWAAANLTPDQRASATVYTSGEHCPMCAAAHALVGLGRIVYASSSAQLTAWRTEWGLPAGPVLPLPIQEVAPDVDVAGPDTELSQVVRQLQATFHEVSGA
jgi:tRNA(Arg) A34 adenosine deaminase TadA